MTGAFVRLLFGTTLPPGAAAAGSLQQVQTETIVPASLDHTFGFFADASNLERITPPWLRFGIRTPTPITMQAGTTIDYRIRWHGLPIPWKTRIDVWEPGTRFVDRQVAGPYRWWRHEHLFERAAGGTRVVDRVEFVPRLQAVSRRIVQRDVEQIFAYRREALRRLFGG